MEITFLTGVRLEVLFTHQLFFSVQTSAGSQIRTALSSQYSFMFALKLVKKPELKGVVCYNSNPINFFFSIHCSLCVCSVHTQPWLRKWETELLGPSHTTRAHAEDNSEFDCGIVCVYCEYLPLHLFSVSGIVIICVSKSINIHAYHNSMIPK